MRLGWNNSSRVLLHFYPNESSSISFLLYSCLLRVDNPDRRGVCRVIVPILREGWIVVLFANKQQVNPISRTICCRRSLANLLLCRWAWRKLKAISLPLSLPPGLSWRHRNSQILGRASCFRQLILSSGRACIALAPASFCLPCALSHCTCSRAYCCLSPCMMSGGGRSLGICSI